MEIEIFQAERAVAGLAEQIQNNRLSIASRIVGLERAEATDTNQIDLAYLKSVLVTTTANLNDDVFDPQEVWAARHTPEDKPFNYNHNQADIIGHITGCYAANDDYQLIPDDTSVENLPDTFHLIAEAVLYKRWEDEELQERMQNILAEIAKGEWCVSMECLFKSYDYLLVGTDNRQIVKARTAESAFLTKYLRSYGGSGKYGDFQVKRLLRNIVFSGKGLVKVPANPQSIILPNENKTESRTMSESLYAKFRENYEHPERLPRSERVAASKRKNGKPSFPDKIAREVVANKRAQPEPQPEPEPATAKPHTVPVTLKEKPTVSHPQLSEPADYLPKDSEERKEVVAGLQDMLAKRREKRNGARGSIGKRGSRTAYMSSQAKPYTPPPSASY